MRFFTTVVLVASATLSLAVASEARPVDGDVLDVDEYPQEADEFDDLWDDDPIEEGAGLVPRHTAYIGSSGLNGGPGLKEKVDAEAHHKGNILH